MFHFFTYNPAGATVKYVFRNKNRNHVVRAKRSKLFQNTIKLWRNIGQNLSVRYYAKVLSYSETVCSFWPAQHDSGFISENVLDSGSSRIVGKKMEHLKLDLIEPTSNSSKFSAIAFNQASHFESISQGLPFDICYSIAENECRGKTGVQLFDLLAHPKPY